MRSNWDQSDTEEVVKGVLIGSAGALLVALLTPFAKLGADYLRKRLDLDGETEEDDDAD